MAGCSRKQYAIMMSAGEEGKKLASEMGGMEQDKFDEAFSALLGSGAYKPQEGEQSYSRDTDEDYGDFDADSDDDYGFDEEDDYTSTIDEMKKDGINVDDPRDVMEYLGANMGLDREDQMAFMEKMGYTPDDLERLRNPDDDDNDNFEDDGSEYLDKTWSDYFSKQKGWERQENGRYDFGDDMNYGSVNNDGEEPGKLTATRVRNGDHEHPEKEFFEDPQEAREWVEEGDNEDDFEWTEAEERQIDKYAEHYGADANAMKKSIYAKAQEYMKGDNMGDEEAYDKAMEEVLDEVANGEYNREMKKAQEQNADMSEGQDENKTYHFEASDAGEEPDDFTLDGIKYMIDHNLEGEPNRENVDRFLKGAGLNDENARAEVLDKLGYEDKGNPYDPEKLPDEGMSQEELNKLGYNQETYTSEDLGYRPNGKGGFDVIQKDTDERDEKVIKSFNTKNGARAYINVLLKKQNNAAQGQPAGEATTKEEWTKRHNDFLERGKSTWNQKLMKGDKVTFEGKDGKDIEGYIGGFWNGGKLTDEDAYEEGKDNNWHDFRGVGIVDKNGKELGSINAYQIKTHGREAKPATHDIANSARGKEIKNILNGMNYMSKEEKKQFLLSLLDEE